MTLFAEAGYDLTDNVSLYFEGLHNRRKTKTDASRQLFFYQFPGVGETVYSEVYGAYYLPYFFCDGSEAAQCDPNAVGDPLNAGFSGGFLLNPIVYAPFDSSTDVKYTRGVIGGRADLSNVLPNGFADVHFQHSRSDGDYTRDIIFRDAVEFGVAAFRTDLCAGTVTAIRGVPCIDINYTDPRVLRGNFTPAERAFLFGVDKGNTLYKQSSGELSFGGDVFQLPAGPFKMALGGVLRRDEIRDRPGEATLADNTFASTTSGITAGFQRTTEGFGEVEIPVLRDQPFFRELTLNGAARITSTYAERREDGESDADKGNWTYKLGANWATTDWLRFRSTYGTSFRSPALFEQFLANESGFLGQAGIDPCIRYEDSENARIRENCAAVGIPEGFPGAGSSAETFSGGGVGVLDPETSKAFTASVILTPQGWLWSGGRFSLAVDYIDIKVKDQVTQLGAANIVRGCYASETFPDDPLCSLFVRAPEGASGEFSILTVQDPYININQQHNKSIDVTTRFRQDLGAMGTLSLLGQATFQLKDKFKLFEGTEGNFNGEAGDPKWVGDLNVTWNKQPFTVTYGLQVIAETNDIDNLEIVGGASLTEGNCLATNAAFALRGGPYCPVYKLPRVAYHSLSAEIEAGDRYSFLFGVANLFDKKPPRVSNVGAPISAFANVPLLGSYYDYIGRRMFVQVRAKLGQGR
jgi:iron complex outermembrane receptor protein